MSKDGAPDSDTLRFYAKTAATYTASQSGDASRHLAPFLAKLKPSARILELGCGSGRDAQAMIAAGFNVDPTDGSAEMAKTAETRLNRPVRIMRFDELEASNAYDAVWANASLLHVPRETLPDILARIFKALKPDGLHFASYKAGTGEGRDQHGRYFNFPSRSELLNLYRQSAGWNIETVEEQTGGSYGGEQVPWIAITARKSKSKI
tara:strand:+ start:1637 stop:2257 length:621 start_codon:yes stop_codon:yes gene_type:complete